MNKNSKEKDVVRNQNGITLLALSITIVILLILAGITVSVLIGENGIISNSKEAKEETEISNEKEIIERATVQAMAEDSRGNIEQDNLQKKLASEAGEEKTEVTDNGTDFEIFFKESKRCYVISKDGNIIDYISIVEDKSPGDITKDENGDVLEGRYEIWSIEDLCDFSNRVNNGKNFYGEEVYLMQSLNFKSKSSYIDGHIVTDGEIKNCNSVDELKESLVNGDGFSPIGKNNGFMGNFDGNNLEIKNLCVKKTEGIAGLFGSIGRGSTIENIIVSGNLVASTVGGIVANSLGGVKILNCTNKANIEGVVDAGGIIGIKQSDNVNNTIISGCANYGIVKAKNAGGIIGNAYNNVDIYNCFNKGNVIGTNITDEYAGIGGIVGTGNKINLKNSYNQANIQGEKSVGGIVGYAGWYNTYIENCYNIGKISGNQKGGIGGRLFLSNDILNTRNCFYLNKDISVGIGYIHDSSEENEDIIGVSEEELKSFEILTKLNEYVEENKNKEQVELKTWTKGENGYPVFIN